MDTKEKKNSNMIPQEKAIITIRRSVNLVMPLTIMGTALIKHLFPLIRNGHLRNDLLNS